MRKTAIKRQRPDLPLHDAKMSTSISVREGWIGKYIEYSCQVCGKVYVDLIHATKSEVNTICRSGGHLIGPKKYINEINEIIFRETQKPQDEKDNTSEASEGKSSAEDSIGYRPIERY